VSGEQAETPPPRVALVTATGAWETDDDAEPLVAALAEIGIDAVAAIWDDPEVDWSSFELAVLRSPWDYTERVHEFLAWAERVEATTPISNDTTVLRWNTDKHYLGELAEAGLSVVPTTYLSAADESLATQRRAEHGDSAVEAHLPAEGQFVVKPTVSSGSRNTARYDSDQRPAAAAHAARLLDEGRDVMVQPYLDSVDDVGETGMLFFAGEFSHGFRKGALLTDGPANVDGLYAREEIASRRPSVAELELAHDIVVWVTERFGGEPPTYARVDVLAGPGGRPMLLELELTEPSYFLETDPDSAPRAARAYAAVLERHRR
jgi:hypothetical protein